MDDAIINKAIGGAVTVGLVYVIFVGGRWLFRTMRDGLRRAPSAIDSAARATGVTAAAVKRQTRSAASAFRDGWRETPSPPNQHSAPREDVKTQRIENDTGTSPMGNLLAKWLGIGLLLLIVVSIGSLVFR